MNERFPVLSGISLLSRVFGWLVLLGAPFILISTLTSGKPVAELNLLVPEDQSKVAVLIGCGFLVLGALFAIALGELVAVFFAIEANTRRGQREQDPLERRLGLPT